ncbi:MAG: GNAT family N-acetyltransferase [Actinomyces sp.]|uniref:GNAT family N-acetyltransferase n=1 Tax=Actinomyces sp. TaxID=29317 RepID=UPI0026DB291D|nr:GNAT family N-acetyltransferase [Actinomyces sp.]MDO4243246.1 GNAT family N-acetyltransferase [Actinomyces sp.]
MTLFLGPLTSQNSWLLEEATLGNMNWCGPRFAAQDVREKPEFAHYTRLLPERGDFGVVALNGDSAVGLAWALFLSVDDPGYGYVDERTPEVSLWVSADGRGQGVGRQLLRALIEQARERGVQRLSLSVEAGNYAWSRYRSEGFTEWPGGEADGVMVLNLDDTHG